ncbi:MAG: FHA domain-containing protein [Myxococcales bacterium]
MGSTMEATTTQNQTLASFAKRYGRLDLDAFLAQFDCPFLVEAAHAAGLRDESGPQAYRTEYIASADASSKLLGAEDRELWPIRKRADSAFSGHIGVGRTPNLDICIARTGVSKFHAYFSEREGVFQLTDKESTNGTFVGGERINPGTPISLRDGVKLEFANHPFTFMSPARFHRLMQSVG